jgi:exodeoxyribonuclease VII small subunit
MTKSKQTIQQKTAKLNELVAWFDSEEFTLEAALDHFKQAEVLAAEIEQDLSTLQNEIEIVKRSFDSEA